MEMESTYLDILQEISELVSLNKSHQKTLKEMLRILDQRMGMRRGLVSIFHKDLGELHADIWHGFETADNQNIKYKLGEGITGKVAEHGVPMAFSQLDDVPFFLNRSGSRKNLDLAKLSFICVPIKYYNEVIGTISVDISIDNAQISINTLDAELKMLQVIASLVAAFLEQIKTEKENIYLRQNLLGDQALTKIYGNSSKVKGIKQLVSQVANSPTTVLITGETGTGKELVAEAIHILSPRKNETLVRINCGAIPESLIESELFGHEKGAFTGAVEKKIGKLESGHQGTVFLDEIGELPLMAQVKLLRVLQEREIQRIGSNKTIPIDIRIIAATNRYLEEDVASGRFRSDLFYRLNVFPIQLPSLRERGADIILLADYFVEKYSRLLNKKVTRISTAAIDALMAYHWPGNVRELENCIERAVIVATENVIRYQDLPPSLQMKDSKETEQQSMDLFRTKVQAYEKELIIDALKSCDGNQAKAAAMLGTTNRIMQYKINRLDIDFRKFRKKQP